MVGINTAGAEYAHRRNTPVVMLSKEDCESGHGVLELTPFYVSHRALINSLRRLRDCWHNGTNAQIKSPHALRRRLREELGARV